MNYEDYLRKFNTVFAELLQITPTVNSVNNPESEADELKIIIAQGPDKVENGVNIQCTPKRLNY